VGKNTTQLVEQLEENNKTKGKKKMKKINWETVKTVVIAILVTAIVAFVGGIKYQQRFSQSVKVEADRLVRQQASVAPTQLKQ
jgi:hypothetical protein